MSAQHAIRGLELGLLLLALTAPVFAEDKKDIEDREITSAIETEMWIDPAMPADRIDVSTHDGIVTFTGKVDSILARERATTIASGVVGVRAVVNRIDVERFPTLSDKAIQNSVGQALRDDPAADSYEVEVTVMDGIVTLTGDVDSWQERRLAEFVAKGVEGVRGIVNKVDFSTRGERPDIEIKRDIESRLANDVLIDDALIDVVVEDNKAILTGFAGSLQEKSRARANAWVTGVEDVDAEGLEVRWWARDEMRRADLFVSKSDDEIAEAIRLAFIYDPRLVSLNPTIEVDNGTVTLSGVVHDLAAKRAAERGARNTMGVVRVKNNLKVRPKVVPRGDVLEQRVTRALIADPSINRFELTVAAANGTVFLSGDVATSWEKQRAESVVERVKGVEKVVNTIDYERAWSMKPDAEILEEVKDQLWWSPFVDSDDINVSVEDGVVTLTGRVDTWSERRTAKENAYEGGAREVRNLLTVTYRAYGPYIYDFDGLNAAPYPLR